MSYGNVRSPQIMVNLFEWIVGHKGYAEENTYNSNNDAENYYDNGLVLDAPYNTTAFKGSNLIESLDSGNFPFWDSCYSGNNLSFGNDTTIQYDFNFDISDGYKVLPLINSLMVVAEDLTGTTIRIYAKKRTDPANGDDSEAEEYLSHHTGAPLISSESYNISSGDVVEQPGYVIIKFNENLDVSDFNHVRVSMYKSGGLGDIKINSLILGSIYAFEHSPKLSVTMDTEFDGINIARSIGGHDSSIASHIGKPNNPFAIDSTGAIQTQNNLSGIEGRKSWDLNFNFLSDSKLLPFKFNDPTDNNYSDIYTKNFFTSVLSKTIGNHLRFLFMPNTQEDFPRDMFMCRFGQNSFPVEEVAPALYNMNLKIVESW